MSERGVFAIDRGAWEHDFLADDQPFSRREAWFWLVSEAAWKPHHRRILGRQIELARGQYCGSLRFIASKWRWSEPRVRRFLSGLISEGMVDAKTDAGVTVLTICNYDRYQRVSLPSDAMRETDVDAAATQQRRKVEDKEDKEDTSSLRSEVRARENPIVIADDWPADYREQFWRRYPNKVGKPRALAKLDGCRKRGIEFAAILDGLDRYIRTKPPDRPWLNPETFLNQERWADQPATVAAQGTPNGRRTVHDAARNLTSFLQALDEPAPGLCEQEGGSPLRLLPPR